MRGINRSFYKAIIAIFITFLLGSPAYASGGFGCQDKDGKFSISGATTRGTGNALYGDITLNGRIIPRAQVVNYKSMNKEFYILVLDSQVDQILAEVEAFADENWNFTGKAKLLSGQSLDIGCFFE